MEAELPTVVVVGKAEDRGRAVPEGTATVRITLVLLQLLQILQKHDSITNHQTPNLLEVAVCT